MATEAEDLKREFHELTGAVNAIGVLRDKLKLRLLEARDNCVREVLDNTIELLGAHHHEYEQRRDELQESLGD